MKKGKTAMGDAKRREGKRTFLNASVVGALIGFIAVVAVPVVQGWMNSQLQEKNFQSELILRVIDKENSEEQVKYLKFIRDLGLIPEYADRVEAFIENPERIPSLKYLRGHVKATSSSGAILEIQPRQP